MQALRMNMVVSQGSHLSKRDDNEAWRGCVCVLPSFLCASHHLCYCSPGSVGLPDLATELCVSYSCVSLLHAHSLVPLVSSPGPAKYFRYVEGVRWGTCQSCERIQYFQGRNMSRKGLSLMASPEESMKFSWQLHCPSPIHIQEIPESPWRAPLG